MRAAYSLFRGESTEGDLAKQMEAATANHDPKSGAPYFYANLYLGLYSEAKGDDALARKCERFSFCLAFTERMGNCPKFFHHAASEV